MSVACIDAGQVWLDGSIPHTLDLSHDRRGTLRIRKHARLHGLYDVYNRHVRSTLQRKCYGFECHFEVHFGRHVPTLCCADVP